MDKESSGRKYIDPRLLSLIDASEELPWLFMENLNSGDILEVQTKNTLYTMRVIDPKNGEVMVNSNGQYIKQETEGTVGGTTLTGTGTMIKFRGITVGLSLVLAVKGIGRLILSPTQKVYVNGIQILPTLQKEYDK